MEQINPPLRLTQLLDRAVQFAPDAIATICGDRTRTWRESAGRISRLAHALEALMLKRGEPVAILAQNSDHYFEFYYAVLRAGGVVDPMNNRWATPEIAFCLNDSKARILFMDDVHAPLARDLKVAAPSLTHFVYIGDSQAPDGFLHSEDIIRDTAPGEDRCPAGEEIAAIFYTGGTTGRSKGVLLSARAIYWAQMVSQTSGVRVDGGATLYTSPMFHPSGGMSVFIGTGSVGAHIFMPKFDAGETLRLIEAHRPFAVTLAPAMLQMMLDHPDFPRRDVTGLGVIVYGMSPMPEAILQRAIKAMPHVGFLQAYGQTETMGAVTFLKPRDHARGLLQSCGRATVVADIRIVDEHGHETARGEVGEVWVRTPTGMSGYLNLPKETNEVMRDGWIRTGDAACMNEEGYIFIVDRKKDMIITGGENVYSAEVENVLAAHPAVAACAVIGIPDERWGERVHAIIHARPDAHTTAEEIIRHCRTRIAGYKTPKSVEFRDEPLPLTGVGKVNKAALRAPYWRDRTRAVN